MKSLKNSTRPSRSARANEVRPIFLSGSIALDTIMMHEGRFAEALQPDKMHVLSLSFLIEKVKETWGGIGSNIAYSLAMLGEKPFLCGAVGADAREYLEKLQGMGVDTSMTYVSAEKPTARFTAFNDLDNNQLGGFYPGAMTEASNVRFQPGAHKMLTKRAVVVISANDPLGMSLQVADCREHGWRLFYDAGMQIINCPVEDIRSGVSAASLLIVNDYEMGLLEQKTGWSLSEMLDMVETIVVTRGKQGSALYSAAEQWLADTPLRVPALRVKNVIDPTGAGDAYRAGFLYGFARNWSLERCAKLGSTVASYAVEHHGAQEHVFTRSQVATRYKQYYKETLSW